MKKKEFADRCKQYRMNIADDSETGGVRDEVVWAILEWNKIGGIVI